MPLIINTNLAASTAAMNLNRNNSMLQKSLARLSSGSKITSSADDAGGLAVSMKLEAAIARTDATSTNVANAGSFLQTQDGALKSAGQVLNRISELKLLSTDVTKSASDVAAILLAGSSLFAQSGKASLSGTVSDPSRSV